MKNYSDKNECQTWCQHAQGPAKAVGVCLVGGSEFRAQRGSSPVHENIYPGNTITEIKPVSY